MEEDDNDETFAERAILKMRRLCPLLLLAASFLAAGCQTSLVSSASAGLFRLSISPTSLNFGSTTVGNTAALSVTITNNGISSVTLDQNGVTGGPGFTTTGIGSGLTLAPDQSATLQVQFRPTANGSVSGAVALSSNISRTPVVIALSGNGVTQTHFVTLNWNSESGVVGYNVYRRSVDSDPWIVLNAFWDPAASYTDSTVLSGQSYSYAVSAIGSDGLESALSEIVSVTIPST